MAKKQSGAVGSAQTTKPGGRQQQGQQTSGGRLSGGAGSKELRKVGIRTTRRVTTDPFTTEIAAKELIGLRAGRLEKPTPEPYVRAFPLAKTVQKQPVKRLRKLR